MEQEEIWKDIEGYEGLYQVSNMGRVKSLIKGIILKFQDSHRGYYYCNLYKKGVPKTIRIHRVVAETFIPNDDQEHKTQCDHINECKHDNRQSNLRWATPKQNCNNGSRNKRIGLKHTNRKDQSKQVYQYTIDGMFVREWESTMEIERELGFKHNNISYCCNGKAQTAYGFIWRFASDVDKEKGVA